MEPDQRLVRSSASEWGQENVLVIDTLWVSLMWLLRQFYRDTHFKLAYPDTKARVKTKGMAFFTPYLCPEIVFNERQKNNA